MMVADGLVPIGTRTSETIMMAKASRFQEYPNVMGGHMADVSPHK